MKRKNEMRVSVKLTPKLWRGLSTLHACVCADVEADPERFNDAAHEALNWLAVLLRSTANGCSDD